MKKNLSFITNPFDQIAGFKALIWGLFGMTISIVLSYLSGWHYHGLLHFGPAPNSALWCYAIEHIIVWLIPSVFFYIGGLLLSRSKIRLIDVLGTVAFAQLPLLINSLVQLSPPLQQFLIIDTNMPIEEITKQPGYTLGASVSMILVVFLVWTLIWMFKALRISCNLKGFKLTMLYIISIGGGEMIIRYLIRMCY